MATVPDPLPDAPGSLVLELLAPGFEYGRYRLPVASALGDSTVRIVRVDPARVRLDVRAASLLDGELRPPSAWAAAEGGRAVAVINVSMFQEDWLTSVGHLVDEGRVQNPGWAARQNALLVLDPVDPAAPRARVLDLACGDREAAVAGWRTRVQSIRMLGCAGENVWAEQPRAWSSALVGQDREGRILMLHTRSPYPMHALVEQLRASPLGLVALHYGDGGPPAAMYVRGPGVEAIHVGSFETGVEESDDNRVEWPIPNVLVAVADAPEGAGRR